MAKQQRAQYRLSPSSLNLYLDCGRCFWMDKVKKIRRPRGIFPSLPSGMDRVIKSHFDDCRQKGCLPPEMTFPDLKNLRLFPDQSRLERWRNWRTGLVYEDENGSSLFGALDDLLVLGDRYVPFDYKTKGSPTTEEDAVRYYQNQLDCYALLLEANGCPTAGMGFLLYYSPRRVAAQGVAEFEVQPIRISTDPDRARKTFHGAVDLLNAAEPESSAKCEYCGWLNQMN